VFSKLTLKAHYFDACMVAVGPLYCILLTVSDYLAQFPCPLVISKQNEVGLLFLQKSKLKSVVLRRQTTYPCYRPLIVSIAYLLIEPV
jgi:hypothetical protein